MTDERALAEAALAFQHKGGSPGYDAWPNVAKRVRDARERLGFSEAEVAERLGISDSEYQDIEFHDDEAFMVFPLDRLARLASLLELRLEAMLFGPDAPAIAAPTDFATIANRLQQRAATERLTLDELGDRIGWELAGMISNPESMGDELPVSGLYDLCSAVGIDWVSALPRRQV
jgi:transcriptional regulator with XRE-family HTH domain